MSIWRETGGTNYVQPLDGQCWRVVESQRQVATVAITSSLESQAVLEELLEAHSKPPLPPAAADLHYLLGSPFRYPPLLWGSRFGRRFEPGIFYGAVKLDTALSECAFYRFVYLSGMETPPPNRINSQHTAFTLRYRCERAVLLQRPPFDAYPSLSSPSSYRDSQALGTEMRENRVQLAQFRSARDGNGGINVAVFDPAALASRRPGRETGFYSQATPEQVEFKVGSRLYRFERSEFEVDGHLPLPPG
ncbi:RES family NAD+ phosphorylase [Microbulbifer litoralis]|uniref:RES family NAD+ phosphorylase n=1 Tax=Microbulbifer litoralis TaxID=2933965 RepID=UPI0020293FDE|nr:RES family NAD+ phosphorylase [Microbulbifer sp. GX H0434]